MVQGRRYFERVVSVFRKLIHAVWNVRFKLARWLVRGRDGMIISRNAWESVIDKMAKLAEWSHAETLSKRAAAAHEAEVENVTRMLGLAASVCDPTLSLEEIRNRYANLRLRYMSPKRRNKLGYEAALKSLEARHFPSKYQSDVQPPEVTNDRVSKPASPGAPASEKTA